MTKETTNHVGTLMAMALVVITSLCVLAGLCEKFNLSFMEGGTVGTLPSKLLQN